MPDEGEVTGAEFRGDVAKTPASLCVAALPGRQERRRDREIFSERVILREKTGESAARTGRRTGNADFNAAPGDRDR